MAYEYEDYEDEEGTPWLKIVLICFLTLVCSFYAGKSGSVEREPIFLNKGNYDIRKDGDFCPTKQEALYNHHFVLIDATTPLDKDRIGLIQRLILNKDYIVHGLKRRTSIINTDNIDHLYDNYSSERFCLHYGDLVDTSNVFNLIKKIQPDEIYNLAAQSHVQVSFETPEYTANADAIGPLRLLEAIRLLNLKDKVRFYQASTSELYGDALESPQNENTPFNPRSPYAAAKLYAYWITVNYRLAYNIYASNGILFNHESPVRGETFVSRKITRAVAAIKMGLQEQLYIGNLDAVRDWGHAKDYVEGMWLILQQEKPDDYVLASGESHSVREFIECAFSEIGEKIEWREKGIKEVGFGIKANKILIEVDSRYFRPTEVNALLGDATKAKKNLGWQATTKFRDLVKEMVSEDLKIIDIEKGTRNFGIDD